MLSFGQDIKTYFNRTMNSYVNHLTVEVNMSGYDPETVNLDITEVEMARINKISSFNDEDI